MLKSFEKYFDSVASLAVSVGVTLFLLWESSVPNVTGSMVLTVVGCWIVSFIISGILSQIRKSGESNPLRDFINQSFDEIKKHE